MPIQLYNYRQADRLTSKVKEDILHLQGRSGTMDTSKIPEDEEMYTYVHMKSASASVNGRFDNNVQQAHPVPEHAPGVMKEKRREEECCYYNNYW